MYQHCAIIVKLSSYLQALSAVVPAAVVGATRPRVVAEAQSIKAQHTAHTVTHQTYLLKKKKKRKEKHHFNMVLSVSDSLCGGQFSTTKESLMFTVF